jgi:hypothetical protein
MPPNAEARRHRGFCDYTPEGVEGDCDHGARGSFMVPAAIKQQGGIGALQRHCTQRCHACGRCRFVSFSAEWGDCSWFRSCRLSELKTDVRGFWTLQIQGSTSEDDDESEQAASAVASSTVLRFLQPPVVKGSFSQAAQDWCLVHQVFRFRQQGFYLDLAANDAIEASNTYALDRLYNWSGLCIEPLERHHAGLLRHRTCSLAQAVVGSGGPATFLHAPNFHEQSGLAGPQHTWTANSSDRAWRRERVMTVPLLHLLRMARAPRTIDYFSLDCEGCEHDVMRSFPWEHHDIGVMTVERPGRKLHRLLMAHGMCVATNFFGLPNADLLYLSAAHAGADAARCVHNPLPAYVAQEDTCARRGTG